MHVQREVTSHSFSKPGEGRQGMEKESERWKPTNVLQSLSYVVTALANGRLLRVGSCGITCVLPSLSNVVTASANGRLPRVDSSGEARGLLQKPGSRQGDCCQSLKAHNFAPRRAKADLTADLALLL
jgi:hypothetical protein